MKINDPQFSVIFRYLENACWLKTTKETRCNVYRDEDYIIIEPADGTDTHTFFHADTVAAICAPFHLTWYITFVDDKVKAYIML